jgi:predicted phosphodiesterase
VKIVVITDLHANLPALEALFTAIRAEGCDALFHTGDAIAIGPQPAECLDLLLRAPNPCFVGGNHEDYYVEGIPHPRPPWMSEGEAEHQQWTHAQLGPQLRPLLAGWPRVLRREFAGVRAVFVHYGFLPSGHDFAPYLKEPNAAELDKMFKPYDADLVFYGHDHRRSDLQGRARYVNPGSAGCYHKPVARYCVAEFCQGRYQLEHRRIEYQDEGLYRAFEERRVPDRHFIYRAFFGGAV